MIELKNINKSYKTANGERKVVLDNVSFSVDEHTNIGVLGRNGAGKSTILKLICGLEMPDSGKINTSGRKVSWPLGSAAGVHGSLTGRENIKFVSRLYGMDFDKMYSFVEKFADLKEYMYMPVRTYSSGMKGRLAFGLSMAIDCDTYLIDEGFSAGDAHFRKKTTEMFNKRRERSNLILVTHNPTNVIKLCNKVIILNAGQISIYDDIYEGIEVYKKL